MAIFVDFQFAPKIAPTEVLARSPEKRKKKRTKAERAARREKKRLREEAAERAARQQAPATPYNKASGKRRAADQSGPVVTPGERVRKK